jgi:hypothetical protein
MSSPEPDICSGKGPVIRTILDSYQATVGLLDLAGGLFRPAGLQIPEAPTLSGGTDTTSLSGRRCRNEGLHSCANDRCRLALGC